MTPGWRFAVEDSSGEHGAFVEYRFGRRLNFIPATPAYTARPEYQRLIAERALPPDAWDDDRRTDPKIEFLTPCRD